MERLPGRDYSNSLTMYTYTHRFYETYGDYDTLQMCVKIPKYLLDFGTR